jgi:exodeoxyribonuclease VIII
MKIKTQSQFEIDSVLNQLHGVYDIPNDVYHSSPGISKSGLDLINKSPAHYKFKESSESTPSMRMGTIIHSAILEPHLFEKDYMLLEHVEDKRKAEYKEAVKEYGKDNVLTSKEANLVRSLQEQVLSNKDASELLNKDGYSELSLFAKCPTTSALLKCRFDYLTTDGFGIDLKTTRSANERDFSRSIYDYRYHVQNAFYAYVYKLVFKKPLYTFIFIAVETTSPYFNKVWQLSQESVLIGAHEFKKNLQSYTKALELDYWPMPNQALEDISLPSWAIEQYEEEIEQEIK